MARDRGACSISRRSFAGLCWASVGLFVAPVIAFAQPSKAIRRIGVLDGPEPPELLRGQAEALRQLGWVEGQNLHVERRVASDERLETLRALAEELVRAQVEIIVTDGTAATLAAMRATTTIPIVIRDSGDPVLLGLVASLARPGGNVTGYTGRARKWTRNRCRC